MSIITYKAKVTLIMVVEISNLDKDKTGTNRRKKKIKYL